MTPFEIGDWVKGKSKDGELIRGFIEAIDFLQGTVKVYVVACDQEKTIGRTIETLNKWVKKCSVSETVQEDQIHYLVDLALETHDVEWFNQLSTQLNTLRSGLKRTNQKERSHFSPVNRLGQSGIKNKFQ